MRILLLETEAATSEVRLRPLLDHLVGAGAIEGYAVVDRDMAMRPRNPGRFDVALTHRIPNARQLDWLRRHRPPLIYDIDDLLTRSSLSELPRRRREEADRLDWCLANADIITVAAPKLAEALGERGGEALRRRLHLMPNCGRETPAELRRNGRPTLLWVSSSAHRWTDELAGIAAGIGAALSEHGNDLHLVGRFPPELAKALPPPILHQRWVPFAQFMALLAEGPFVAVAPLAHGLDAEEQAFLDCKSDIKAAQYGSSRIAAAYSAAIPYRDSDLPAALVPENTAAAWRSATSTLIEEFPAAGNRVGDDPAFQARRPSVVATSLLGMLERVRQPSRPPFSFRAIPTPRVGRYLEQSLRSARARLFPRR